MKKLSKIRLINWYHLEDATIPVHGSALFMGDNGSGKSTILDAIQFALVADLTQVRFNHAANEQADRTLQGYTRWMVNSGGGSKEGHQYNRGDCTSYVLLEFLEPDAEGEGTSNFTIGVAIDSYRDGRDPNRLHFICNQTAVEDIPLFRENSRVPLSTAEFRQKMTPRKGFYGSREPGPFRDNLLTRLGRLSPDFTKILVKALAFKPLGQVHQFVMDFLLDERPLETQSLQANLASYKALEQKSIEAERRVQHLEKIVERSAELGRLRDDILAFKFLEMRGLAGVHEERLLKHEAGLEKARSEKARIAVELDRARKLGERTEEELASVWKSLSENSGYVERERTKDRIFHARGDREKTAAQVTEAETGAKRLSACREEMSSLLGLLDRGAVVPESDAEAFRGLGQRAWAEVIQARAVFDEMRTKGQALEQKLAELKKGVRPYEKEVRALRQLIEDQLDCPAPLLCELLEISDEKWQAAVEGYLNTRRFDIVLDPRYFKKALALYEKHKRQLGLHGVGLVDSEKVLKSGSKSKPGSLAEVVESENPHAKAYANFILGDVIRCESEQELRGHSRAITPTCMVYQNFSARQTPFHVFDNWFIGSRGRERLLESMNAEFAQLTEDFRSKADLSFRWEKMHSLARTAEDSALRAAALPELRSRIEGLSAEIVRLEEHLERISTGEIAQLERRLGELRALKEELEERIEAYVRQDGGIDQELVSLGTAIETEKRDRDHRLAELAVEFGSEERKPKAIEFEERYRLEVGKKGEAQAVVQVFERQRKARETQKSNLIEELAAQRTAYNNQFGFAGPAQGEDTSPYLLELDSWKNSHLPEYRAKIEKAKDSALHQLMEDVVHRLRENLDLIPAQFEQINRALRGFSFGHDQYQFIFRVKREFESFEKLIREAALYERQPLFETNWKERFRDGGALEALFDSMVSGSTESVQKELQQYSDYRQYYDYDLKILRADGTHALFSQINPTQSGGETQTPYYIAVLASLYRLYRLRPETSSKQRGTIGLVVLDEAFNKMDEDHLRATLGFTRQLGLQLIMATPKERAEFIIPHVESTWIVAKDPQSGRAFTLDYHQDLEGGINDERPLRPEHAPEIAPA